MRDYRDAHPTSAVLVVEVSHESLRHDRTIKQRLYARCGIPEYWILALPENRLEVYRDPAGDGYRSVTHHAAGDEVAPLARPDARIVGPGLSRPRVPRSSRLRVPKVAPAPTPEPARPTTRAPDNRSREVV